MKRWKIILSFLAVFLAGGMVGGALSARYLHHFFFAPPHASDMAQRIMKDLQSELALTPAQTTQIQPLVVRTADEAAAVHREVLSRLKVLFQDSDRAIGSLLTPEQNVRFEKMKSRRPQLPGKP